MTRRGWTAGCASALLVLLILIALAGVPSYLEALFALVAGWARHAASVLPKVTVNWSGVGLMAVCLALALFLGHRFARWLWQGTGHAEPWRPKWTAAGMAVVVLLFAAGMAFTGIAHQAGWLIGSPEPLTRSAGASAERNASASLKTVFMAQADFRANDRDGNQKADYWRGDVAGLYALVPDGGGDPIKLIDLSIAIADDRPATDLKGPLPRTPKAGHWYRALGFRGETTPDPDRFAACAFPSSPTAGRFVFIISDANIMYRKEGVTPPEVYPDDPDKEGWARLD